MPGNWHVRFGEGEPCSQPTSMPHATTRYGSDVTGSWLPHSTGQGRTFIGTPDEAAEHMMASADR